MDHSELKDEPPIDDQPPKESFLKVIVHSFFVIPFLIAVFCALLFAGMHLLTSEKRSAFDYLKDVKSGGESKRWQAAFELSKMLANADVRPKDTVFYRDLLKAFEASTHDASPLVRQYLALAMGRSGQEMFTAPLVKALKQSDDDQLPALIFAVGMLKDPEAAGSVAEHLEHDNPRVRALSAAALGEIGHKDFIPHLKKVLSDVEPNVQWTAAVSLARMGDSSGKGILLKLLDREYLAKFPEVDAEEQKQLMLAAIESSALIKDEDLLNRLAELAKTDPNMKIRAKCMEAVGK